MDKKAFDNLILDLETRANAIDATRSSSCVPEDVYENGLYWGLMIAIGEIKKLKRKA